MTPVNVMAVDSEHVWDRTAWGWHVAFGVFAVVTAVLVVTGQGTPAGRRAVVLALLAVMCAWYAGTGARVLHSQPRGPLGQWYLGVAVPLTITMFVLAPPTSVMLFALYPHIWSLLPTRQAVWATAATTVSVSAAVLLTGGPQALGGAAVVFVLGLLVALVMGLWISKIIDQSMERARLAADLAATRTELAAASRQAGILAERERLARDLHDTLAQGSTSVLMLLQAARNALGRDAAGCERHLELAERTTRENLGEIRSLVAALTPARLDGVPLLSALERLAEAIGQETGIAATVSVTGTARALPLDREVTLLRVAQEALANVRRHSQATVSRVEVGYHEDRVTLAVIDNGRGFDPARPAGFGLDGLRSRIREAHGELSLDTALGTGTRLAVSLPAGGGQ